MPPAAGLRRLALGAAVWSLTTLCSGARWEQRLDVGWYFHRGEDAAAVEPAPSAAWLPVVLPHDWSISLPRDRAVPAAGDGGFSPTGIGWYRRIIAAPAAWSGRCISLVFEGSAGRTEAWLNGIPLGSHPYAFTPFRFDLTPYLRPGTDNVLTVRVDNSAQPCARWYTGSGIYRHVWLEVSGPVSLVPDSLFVTTTALEVTGAAVQVRATVANRGETDRTLEAVVSLTDPSGRRVAQRRIPLSVSRAAVAGLDLPLHVPRPQAWSPDSPALYRLEVQLRDGGEKLDEVSVPAGLRTLRISAERGFELNGIALKLNGGSVHHDNGVLGAAAFDRAEERKVELLKAAGFNAVRTAHNPPSPAFLAACDRLGLLVVDELFDGWAKAKTRFDYAADFPALWERDLEAWVRRDRNHPAVVVWSTGNEMFERSTPEGQRIARELAGRIRELDPTRPVTAGVNAPGKGTEWGVLDPLFAAFDLAGYNYELGRQAADHARLPNRVIFASESYQSEVFANWGIVHDQPYVIGDFVWSALDYLGESGIGRVFPPDEPVLKHWEGNMWPWHGAYCGDTDLTGWRKPVSHYRRIVWDAGEKLYAAVRVPTADGRLWNVTPWSMPPALPVWTWSGREGQPLTIEVYSRHETVRLECNGRQVGEAATDRAHEFRACFTLPFTPGELVAVGCKNGHEQERFTLRTAGPVARLRLTADRPALRGDGQDLAFVTIEAVDARDTWNPEARNELSVEVVGPATLQGLGTGDMTAREGYASRTCHLYQGRALAVVRVADQSGRITVRVTAAGLPPANLSLAISAP